MASSAAVALSPQKFPSNFLALALDGTRTRQLLAGEIYETVAVDEQRSIFSGLVVIFFRSSVGVSQVGE